MPTHTQLEKITAITARWSLIIIGALVISNTGYYLLSNTDNDYNWWLLMLGFIIQLTALLIGCWCHHPPLKDQAKKATPRLPSNLLQRFLLILATSITTLGIVFYLYDWRSSALSLLIGAMACCLVFRHQSGKQLHTKRSA